jgi:hypothetical protein
MCSFQELDLTKEALLLNKSTKGQYWEQSIVSTLRTIGNYRIVSCLL